MRDFLDYLRDISDGATQTQIATAAGVAQSSVGRWNTSKPQPDVVVRLAHHYGRPPLEAMIAAGWITEQDARVRAQERSLSDYSDTALLREVGRRMAQTSDRPGRIGSPSDYGEEPIPDEYDLAAGDVARDPDLDR
jgi:hypothetical protein